jgi:hypothetical protein
MNTPANDAKIKNFFCSEHGEIRPIVTPKCPKCTPANETYNMPSITVDGHEWIRKIDHDTLLTQNTADTLKRVREWVNENEYCSKCCSPKKFCPEWGKHASAIDTADLLAALPDKSDKQEV